VSIDQSDKVDFVGVEAGSGKVVLTISDHLSWSDVGAHLRALEDKLNAYLRFVESGELLTAYPDAVGRQPVIDLVTAAELPTRAFEYLAKVRPMLESAGIEFRTRVLVPKDDPS
jgi:hypothetical protein